MKFPKIFNEENNLCFYCNRFKECNYFPKDKFLTINEFKNDNIELKYISIVTVMNCKNFIENKNEIDINSLVNQYYISNYNKEHLCNNCSMCDFPDGEFNNYQELYEYHGSAYYFLMPQTYQYFSYNNDYCNSVSYKELIFVNECNNFKKGKIIKDLQNNGMRDLYKNITCNNSDRDFCNSVNCMYRFERFNHCLTIWLMDSRLKEGEGCLSECSCTPIKDSVYKECE